MYPLDICPFLGHVLKSSLETVYVAWLCGKIKKISMANPGIRISIFGSSCSGFFYVDFLGAFFFCLFLFVFFFLKS